MHFNGQFELYRIQYKKRIEYSRYVSSVYTFWKVVFSLRLIFEEVGNSFVVAINLKDIILVVCSVWNGSIIFFWIN